MRRRGLARELLALAVAEAKARGIKVVTLHASKFGKPVYEQNGFKMSNEMMLRFDEPGRISGPERGYLVYFVGYACVCHSSGSRDWDEDVRGQRSGQRSATPKQFLSIAGVPVLVHCLRAFLAVKRVEAIYVAVRKTEIERVQAQVAEFGLRRQGPRRRGRRHPPAIGQQRAGQAGRETGCGEDDVVLVHDAARPLIDPATIDRTIDAVAEHGAAIVGLPAVDTIKQVERTAHGAIVTATIPRERLCRRRPPGSALRLLQRAFAEAVADEFAGTDEASLLERAGIVSPSCPDRRRTSRSPSPETSNWQSSTCKDATDQHDEHDRRRRRNGKGKRETLTAHLGLLRVYNELGRFPERFIVARCARKPASVAAEVPIPCVPRRDWDFERLIVNARLLN